MKAVFHNNGLVERIVYDTSILNENEIKNAILVNEIPNPIKSNYKMYINRSTKEITFEYMNTEVEEKIKLIEEENANINYILMKEGLI